MDLPEWPAEPCLASPERVRLEHLRSSTVSRRVFGNSMPITFRPGTTATRTAVALMDRAISSASPITRADLVPACRLQLEQRHNGAGLDVLVLALHAEVGQYILEEPRGAAQDRLREFRTRLAARGRFNRLTLGRAEPRFTSAQRHFLEQTGPHGCRRREASRSAASPEHWEVRSARQCDGLSSSVEFIEARLPRRQIFIRLSQLIRCCRFLIGG